MNGNKYPIFFFEGETMPADAKVEPAKGWFDGDAFAMEGRSGTIRIGLSEMLGADLYRAGAMTVIRVRHPSGVIHLAATRLLIGRSFAIVNAARTREIHRRLAGSVRRK